MAKIEKIENHVITMSQRPQTDIKKFSYISRECKHEIYILSEAVTKATITFSVYRSWTCSCSASRRSPAVESVSGSC